MKKVIKLLEENPMGALATNENGRPKVRPFGFMLAEHGKFYFCTANTKDVFRQLNELPLIEFTTTSKDLVTARISGEIKFTNDLEMKEKILNSSELVKSIYQTADNPTFEIFYLENGEAIVSDLSGQPSKKYNF